MDNSMQLSELRKIAKERGLKNISKLKKDELIELLDNSENEDVEKNVQEDNVLREDEKTRCMSCSFVIGPEFPLGFSTVLF